MTPTATTGTVPVNGLEMYNEIHGEGQPLVLLHGAFSAIGSSFGELLPGLAERRKVVALGLRGHGRGGVARHVARVHRFPSRSVAPYHHTIPRRTDARGRPVIDLRSFEVADLQVYVRPRDRGGHVRQR